jgi:hypothetical protein
LCYPYCMRTFLILLASVVLALAHPVPAQEMPAEYAAVLKTLSRQGDYKDGVLKVNIPRNDVNVSIDGVATPTPFGFGGWIALTKGDHGDVMMGDLVLTENEVNPVMSAVLDNGLEVTALHNHFFYDTPRMFYMHVHGHGATADIAKRIAPALALIGKTRPPASVGSGKPIEGKLDVARLATIVGQEGEQTGAVYKFTIGRPDIPLKEMGAAINARMGLNTWAAFYGTDADAVVAGDVAMRAEEVMPVLKALRSNGIDVVAIHHHMVGTETTVYFLHYWGRGPAEKLASSFRAAVEQTGHKAARR